MTSLHALAGPQNATQPPGPVVSTPELAYRGLAFCDLCGAPLQPEDVFSGLHSSCLASLDAAGK